jgi:hypothetical protein
VILSTWAPVTRPSDGEHVGYLVPDGADGVVVPTSPIGSPLGPAQDRFKWLRHRLAYRAQSLRDAPRTNQLLRLMVAGRNGEADERAWAERIRRRLIEHDGRAPRQRQLVGSGGL